MIPNDMWVGGKEGLKEKYLSLWGYVNRDGNESFLEWLDSTDFFTAPASAKNHNNYESGLVEHYLNVYYILESLCIWKGTKLPVQSLIIASLTHDICKCNFYKSDMKNNKVNGVWIKEPFYSIDDLYPLGHGEKSVIILQKFMKLTDQEIMAIRWHMMGFDDTARSYAGMLSLSKAMQEYPLITLLHCADLFACLPETDQK